MHTNREKGPLAEYRYFWTGIIVTVLFFVGGIYLFLAHEASLRAFIESASGLSIAAYILFFVISIVVAPISATPLIGIGVQIWGVLLTTLLSVLGWTIGAMIAFLLARHFGEPFVRHMLSKQQEKYIDRFTSHDHMFWVIVLLRAVMPFDGLSYILGLTPHVTFRMFTLATALGLIPFCLAIAYVGTLPIEYILIGCAALIIFIPYFYYTVRRVRRRKQIHKEQG